MLCGVYWALNKFWNHILRLQTWSALTITFWICVPCYTDSLLDCADTNDFFLLIVLVFQGHFWRSNKAQCKPTSLGILTDRQKILKAILRKASCTVDPLIPLPFHFSNPYHSLSSPLSLIFFSILQSFPQFYSTKLFRPSFLTLLLWIVQVWIMGLMMLLYHSLHHFIFLVA